jgi:hypothetical protein
MKLKTHLTVWAILYLVFGLNLLVIPKQFMTIFGCPLDNHGVLIGRTFGSALIGLFLLYYMLRNINRNNSTFKAIIYCSLIFNALSTPFMATATLNGVMNQLGWFPVMVNITIVASSLLLINQQTLTQNDIE